MNLKYKVTCIENKVDLYCIYTRANMYYINRLNISSYSFCDSILPNRKGGGIIGLSFFKEALWLNFDDFFKDRVFLSISNFPEGIRIKNFKLVI